MLSGSRRTHVAMSPKMRNFASCIGDHAVKVSDYYACSTAGGSGGDGGDFYVIGGGSTQSSVTCAYKANIRSSSSSSSTKELLVVLTWSRTAQTGPALSVAVDTEKTQLLWRRSGSQSFLAAGGSSVDLRWDYSSAKFSSGPEPESGFHVAVSVDGEPLFLLGDSSPPAAKLSSNVLLLCRRERVVFVRGSYTTSAPLRDGGSEHEFTINFGGGSEGSPEMSVWIDRKKVVQVRRPKWNFRGNQMAFVDGSPLDVIWDVHGWWCGGAGVFLFRPRSSLEKQLWVEEEMKQQPSFSLLIEAFRS